MESHQEEYSYRAPRGCGHYVRRPTASGRPRISPWKAGEWHYSGPDWQYSHEGGILVWANRNAG